MVEQQVHMIRRVNEWLESGRMFKEYRDYAEYLGQRDVKAVKESEFKTYKHIEVRRMPMTLDFTPGARIVNSESFLRDKMQYGYENALHFLNRIGGL